MNGSIPLAPSLNRGVAFRLLNNEIRFFPLLSLHTPPVDIATESTEAFFPK